MGDKQRIKAVKADWSDIVLVCRKCSKKLKGGFGPGGEQSLPKALSRLYAGSHGAKLTKRRRRRGGLAVFEVGCQDLCPKNAVVVASPALPQRWLVVPKGIPVETLAFELGLRPRIAEPEQPAEPGSGADDCRLGQSSISERPT